MAEDLSNSQKDGNESKVCPSSDPAVDAGKPSHEQQPQLQSPNNFDFASAMNASYSTANEYAKAVQAWLWAYHSWSLNQCMMPLMVQQAVIANQIQFQTTMANMSANQRSLSTTTGGTVGIGGVGATAGGIGTNLRQRQVPTDQQQNIQMSVATETAQSNTGNEYYIATYGRRLVAELIDGLLFFCFKLLFTYFLVEFEFINLDKYDKLFGPYGDLKTFLDIMHELLPYEIVSKLLISCIEAFYLSKGTGFRVPHGCTPGKYIVGVRLLACDSVVSLNPPNQTHIRVVGERRISLWAALCRSICKNFALGFVLPLSLMMYIGRHNRSMYDVACGTVVVEVPNRRPNLHNIHNRN